MILPILFAIQCQWPGAIFDPPGTTGTAIVRITTEPGRVIFERLPGLPARTLADAVYEAVALSQHSVDLWCMASGDMKVVWIATDTYLVANPAMIGGEALNARQPDAAGCLTLPDPPAGFARRSVVAGVVRWR